jgi:hypothetical protein
MPRLYNGGIVMTDGGIVMTGGGIRIIDYDDAMNMVWHNNEFAQTNIFRMGGNFIPCLFGNMPQNCHFHYTIHDVPKIGSAVRCAYCNEIRTIFAVIPPGRPRRGNPVFVFKFFTHKTPRSLPYTFIEAAYRIGVLCLCYPNLQNCLQNVSRETRGVTRNTQYRRRTLMDARMQNAEHRRQKAAGCSTAGFAKKLFSRCALAER